MASKSIWPTWTPTLSVAVAVLLLAMASEAGKAKTFLRNPYSPQDQPQRNNFHQSPSFNRFRRNERDEFEGNPFRGPSMFRPSASFNSRKGGPRPIGRSTDRSYHRYGGGPEAFLEPATTERAEPEEDMLGFKFSGSAGFGASRPAGNPRRGGVSKGGGTKGGSTANVNPFSPAFDRDASNGFSPIRNVGGFGGTGSPGFGTASGSASFGGSMGGSFSGSSGPFTGNVAPAYSGPPAFGGSLPAGLSGIPGVVSPGASSNPGFGGSSAFFPGVAQPGRPGFNGNPGVPFAGAKTTFTGGFPGAGVPGSNPFASGSGNIQFPPSSIFPAIPEGDSMPIIFPQGPDMDHGAAPGHGLNLPFTIDDELAALLFGVGETTTMKPPLRVTSAEDENKIFSGHVDEVDEEAIPPTLLRRPETKAGCNSKPMSPANGRTDCSTYAGCRAVCNPGYQFPNGDRRLYLQCDDGEWKLSSRTFETVPDCEPRCSPPCENNGICLAPNVCQCPDNWEGDQCQIPKVVPVKKCSNKPPTPMNSRIFCSKDECSARCHEGYQFSEGTTRLSFQCENGNWVIQDPRWTETPDCEPACDPSCQNGGRCIAPDLCECTQDFRGDRCQHPITNCDPKKIGFNGGYNCTGEGMDFGCVLWCPDGIEFEFPAEDFYSCDYATSTWSPSPIPNCNYDFLFVTPGSFDISTGTYPPGYIFTTTEEVKKLPGTCFTWSGSHYKSFDGRVFSFESSCPYTLLQDSSHGTFSVNLKTKDECTGPACQRVIQLFLDDEEYVLQKTDFGQPSLEYRETNLAIPGQMNGVVSERVAHYVVVKVAGLGLTIKWDMKNLVMLEINELLWNRTSGICGRRDGNKLNDWSYSDGKIEDNFETFLQAWQSKTIGDRCLDQPKTKNPCGRRSIATEASDFCSRLLKFTPCTQVVDPDPFLAACRWDYCACESSDKEACACESFSAFFKECTNAGVDLPGGWRAEDFCPMECPRGMEYNPCMSAIQPRCGQPADSLRPEFCVEGCDCPSGLLLHNGKCIRAEDCPCTYHSKDYTPGDTIPNDCNSCTCLGGEWVCTEVKCGSRCAVVGDPHYTTFDGRRYDFMGKCTYTLVQGADFSIETENTPCAGAISESMNFPASVVSQFPSCTKSVTVRLDGTTIRLKQKREVTVNGVEVKDLPTWVNGAYIKKASSIYIMVELDNGLDVWWDGQTSVYVDAPSDFRGQMSGLCGTFTDNQRDDFLTPEGDVENNAVAFANKWKTSERCPDQPLAEEGRPCDRHVQNKAVAEKYCAKVKSSLFAKCHLEVDPEPYYRDCLYDMCSCETKLDGCLCPTLASYAKECTRKGILIDWRAEVRECGVHCTGGQKYQVCGNSCTHTCLDIATNPNCKRKCVEGCNCPEGFSLDQDGICVPITDCPCVYQAKEYKPGYEMLQQQTDGKDMVCECFNAGWNCWEPRDNDTVTKPPQVQCPEHLHEIYTDCMPEEENTCQTMHLRTIPGDLCRAGCICGPGYVRNTDTGSCIKHNQCPCHHGGRSYSEGDIIVEDCNTCECEGGQWVCTEEQCPGICSAWGESHYKTFDGKMFEFHGTCDYLLAKGKSPRSDSFEVTVQNVPCGTNGVTCAKSVTLRVGSGDSQEIVEFSRNKPTPTKNLTRTIIREAGVFVFAEVSDMGLVLQWDRGTRAYLRLDPSWKGKVRGLCGNYNDDDQDDFKTPSGGSSEVSVRIFGDSWRLQNYCPDSVLIKDTCSLHPHRKVWASEQCAVLKTDTFAPCHSEVPVEPYLERCQFDACGCDTGGDCHCLCTAVAAYAHECNIHGVFIAWRKPDFCPMQCDVDCEHYEACIPTCPHETCDTLLDPTSPLCVQDACVEGCAKDVCPPGHVYKSATDIDCVPKADCEKKCLEIDGEVYLEGDVISEDDCHTCICTRKKKICRGTPCAPTTTPLPLTPSPSTRITTPAPPITGITPEEGDCRSGWSEFTSDDHPVIFRKNSDVERIPAKLKKSKTGHGFCERSQITDITCRSVGTHRPHTEQRGVTCALPDGLLCRGRDDAQADDACRNYEVAVYCNCSIPTTEAPEITTPVSPVTPPIISTPAVPPVTAPTPMTCEEEGWSQWYNLHYPDSTGEFESVTEIRKLHGICPDHYISEVECRPVGGGDLEDVVTCDTQGARCRNSGGQRYCQDYEIRVRCECECQDGLGMEDWRIPNDKISASSVMNPDDSPQSARLFADWAWTAQQVDQDDQQATQNEWLQVDLGEVKEVTGVITQGHPLFDFYVERFAVQFSETGLQWDSVKEKDTSYALQFTGNTDRNTPVTNLFPEPVFARYIRVIPLQFYQSISLRLELKGCDVKETTTAPAWPVPETTTPIPVCEDGWTEWMNTHTPSPGNWDDLDDLTSLSAKYSFCEPQYIVKTDCRVVGLNQPYELAGQTGVICNINNGLQCNDDLQAPTHCYDYELRFLCDCSQVTTLTTEELPFPSPGLTTPGPIFTLPPSREECTFLDPQIKPHDTDCRKFYECAPTIYGNMEYVEKECGPSTFFHPKNQVCDFEANVVRVRPECKTPPAKIIVTTPEAEETTPTSYPTTTAPCTGHYWTEWFNVSHPDVEHGDIETFEKIRELGYDICADMHIMDVECQYNQVTEVAGGGVKGGTKGGRKSKKGGRRGPPEMKITPSDYTTSRDVRVKCSRDTGLICFNTHQRFRARCEDYAIRALCSCESTKPTPAPTIATTPYIDVRESTVITTPPTSTYVCPPGTRYEPNAISCNRVCLYYQFILRQTGECLREGDFAPACVNITSPVACPGNQYLRDKSTCVEIQDCNCRLPNGMAAPPGRVFRVDECEVCQCSNNYLMCDSSACVLTALPSIKITEEPSFQCNNWTSWISGSSPVDGSESELIKDLGLKYPKLCQYPPKVECRVKDTKESALTAGQNIDCRPFVGLTCKKDLNPEGCKDYEVRFWCDCSDIDFSHGGERTELTTLPTTTYTASHLTNVSTTWRPYMDTCTDDKIPVKCALPCDRVCMYYKQVLRQNGFCELEGDCAPGCLEEKQSLMCPPGFYMLDSNRCVAVADCSCRLTNGLALPAGVWYDVSACERCMCQNNNLLCERDPGCVEISTIEPTVFTEKEVTIEITPRPKISFQCNNWSPYFKKQKNSEGVTISLDTVKDHIDFPCEVPTNASCREAAAKLPASSLGQVLTCDPVDGLLCLNLENSKDCHDYEISFFCECEEESTITPPETTLGPVVTLAPCDAWSPWINEFKPWHSDFETEYKSLQQLRDEYGFCMEGQLADIECVEAATGQSVASDKGTSCDVRYGFSCKNADQDRGQCLDYKIRYYCTCETTTVITTTFVPPAVTLPSVCDPDKFIHLLKDVDDSALSSTRARNTYFGPSNARLYNSDGSLNSKSWGPLINDKNQYLQIDLGSVEPLYGLEMGGNPTTRERVTAYMVQVSDDGTTWSYVPSDPDDPTSKPEEFRGPVSPTAPLKQMFKKPVEARYVRIKPTVWVRSIALRLEVIGCELPTVPTYPITPKPECEEPMGLENGEMSLQQITVSSVLNDDVYFYGKQNIPINSVPGKYTVAGAWVAQPKPEQFVRFDFLEPSKLSGVVTQGRSDTDEWVETFKVRYSQDGKTWSTLQEPDGTDKVFPANYDRNTPVETKFDQMIQARYLEIRPETWKSNIAMRAEVLGCFHPYPEITTTPLPELTTTFPPPPECTPCPGLPEEFYDRCETCTSGTYFDGQTCVPKPICPCYKDGNRYDIGSVFETADCFECECLVGGQSECKEKTCAPCHEIDQGVLTVSCDCICKPCLEGTRLCPSINYCLNETSWCNGVVECPEDELDCPSTTPVIPSPCPTPYCPEFWQLTVRPSSGPCPIVKCEPPAKTTPMPCPIPFCPPLYDISLIPKKGNEMCPKYECIPPSTTMAPPECPPLLCPDGYEVQTSDDVVPEMPFGECPQYQCVTAAPPTAPCPPATCPQGYEIFFADSKVILELCPPYDCVPIVTTTMCPPVECGEGLRTMYIQTAEGSACPQYTCVQVTTPTAITTEPPITCPPMELPICKAGEELYQTNPNELCPRFGCKPFGMTPTPLPEAPRNITPTCTIEGRSFDSFDDSHYQVEPCNHILAEDKIHKDWIITMHRNCSFRDSCDRYLKITQDDQQLILRPDLLIVWDENSYTVSQAQRIGTSRNTFTVSRVGNSIRFSSSVYKYSVEWNTEMNVRIEVDTELTNRVDGLCGFYTGYGHDDKTKPDGKLATTNKDYGQSWALDDQPCEEKPKCTVAQSAESFQLCEAIKNDPFTKCHSAVDPSSFLKGCVATTCDCLREGKDLEECRCQALTHYVTRCLETDSQIKLDDWRIVAKCYKECGPGERYQDCFRATCEKSCENLHDDTACMEREGACVPGCFCSPGLVRKGDRCVNPEKCGDCVCEGYGDPHYQTFDRQNYTFNGECSYVAARDKNIRGQHAFEVITRNKRCTVQPVTVCTDAVTILFKDHTVFIANEGDSVVTVTVDGVDIPTFPHREPWLALEQPDATQIMAAIPEIQLEVTYFLENFGFAVKVPSRLYFNKTEGLCGNCNYRTEDDFEAQGTGLVESSDAFGKSWLLDSEPSSCGIIEKDTTSCIPLPPDVDPCLRIMDEEVFGKCHPVEDPVPYVSSCQLDACGSREPEVAACHSLEAYARRCAELDICLNWRSEVLCPKICPESLVFNPCGPGCVRTCDNYQELTENPDACPISSVDGCFCPEGMVLDNGTCINETFCTTCDDEGHRIGDVWQTDPCTTCECSIRGSSCSTKTCPDDPICDEGYEVVEVPDTGDACCGPRKKCKVIPKENCPDTVENKDECGYGQKHKVIEAPGVCPQYACVCVEPEECPALEVPDDDKLKPGEVWTLDDTGCCARYKTECSDVCPEVECPEFYEPIEKPLKSDQCCPDVSCEPPTDACIYENIYVVDENGFQKTASQPSGVKKGGKPQASETEKKLYKVGEKWDDGLCLKCSCSVDSQGKPRHLCTEQTCPTVDTHPDQGEFQLDSVQVPGQCCPDIVRTACIDDYEVIEIGDRLDDPLNGCRSVECVRHPDGKVDKVEQIHTCDENCPLGWVYEPSPLYPNQCCGECVQVACVVDGEVKDVGDTWVSDDYCTTFTCAKENNRQIQIQAVEVKCTEPSAKDRQDYEYFETTVPGQCCPTYSRTACLMDDIPIAAGDSVQDPLNNCLTVSCEKDKDGNVTRREKEITCDTDCALGQTYIEPIEGSNECCGKCLVTHCMDGGVAHSIGERWESEGDACYEYRCDTRDMVLTTIAVKKDCPYFDPECPPEEIYMDENGCCQLCNVTRPVKSDCKPTPMSPEETVGIFTLTARGVGTCKNEEPVVGLNQCYGHCDSYTEFLGQGRRVTHVSSCFCCKPAKFQKIRVDMRCETGYAFARVYDNIIECQCLRCDDSPPEYLGDEPIMDDADFFAMTEEPLDE